MNKLYTLYIGSNNKTKKLETEKAIRIISEYFTGYTYYEVNGVWEDVAEKSLKVEIVAVNDIYINFLIKSLKKELKQKEIMLVEHNVTVSFK